MYFIHVYTCVYVWVKAWSIWSIEIQILIKYYRDIIPTTTTTTTTNNNKKNNEYRMSSIQK